MIVEGESWDGDPRADIQGEIDALSVCIQVSYCFHLE